MSGVPGSMLSPRSIGCRRSPNFSSASIESNKRDTLIWSHSQNRPLNQVYQQGECLLCRDGLRLRHIYQRSLRVVRILSKYSLIFLSLRRRPILSQKACHKKSPAQRSSEFREEAQLLCSNVLSDRDDIFVSVSSLFDETNLLCEIQIISDPS